MSLKTVQRDIKLLKFRSMEIKIVVCFVKFTQSF